MKKLFSKIIIFRSKSKGKVYKEETWRASLRFSLFTNFLITFLLYRYHNAGEQNALSTDYYNIAQIWF
jgi:hypothetical protein